jgi:hypothetical protein
MGKAICLGSTVLGLVLAQGCSGESETGRQPEMGRQPETSPLSLAGCDDAGGGAPMTDAGGPAPVIPGPPAGTPPGITGFAVRIENKCNIPLYLHTEGGGGPLNPADPVLMPNAVIMPTKNNWPTGWVQVFGEQGHTTLLELVQITVVRGTIWYKFDHGDGIAIPMEVYASGAGPECGKRTGCYVPRAQIMSGCPDGLGVGQKCVAPGIYCADPANASKAVCHALDAKIADCAKKPECAAAAGLSSKQAYDCDKFFGTSYKWCAAINRGIIDTPDSSNVNQFYQGAGVNGYAAWLHTICHAYAFPYDDYNNPADDTMHTCRNATGVSITFCPNG